MYPFVLEVARRGDEGDSGLFRAGGVGFITNNQEKELHLTLAMYCKP